MPIKERWGNYIMRDNLLELINQIGHIRSLFYVPNLEGVPQLKTIYDNAEFCAWKQELQLELEDIHERTRDKFIWSTLVTIRQGFSGWHDEKSFNELCGSLLAIQKNIAKYYPEEIESREIVEEGSLMPKKSPKVFISHCSKDKDYVLSLVELLEDIGLSQGQIFCSSVPGYGIPLGEDIYDYLKKQFDDHTLHVFFVLSDNYYQSVACMNEMGAAWILQTKYTTILLPNFEFREIQGAINPQKIGLKLDSEETDVKEKLGQLKDVLVQEFDLSDLPGVRWERKRDAFISSVTADKEKAALKISGEALKLLQAACDAKDGMIMKSADLSGTYVIANSINFITSQERREVAKWESALDELLGYGLVQARGAKGEIFVVSQNGYNYIEDLTK